MKKHIITLGAIALALCAAFYGDNVIGGRMLGSVFAATSNDTIASEIDKAINDTGKSTEEKVATIVTTAGGTEALSDRLMQDSTMINKIATLEGTPANVDASEAAAQVVDTGAVTVVGAALNGATSLKIDIPTEEPTAVYTNYKNVSAGEFSEPVYLDLKLMNGAQELPSSYNSIFTMPIVITIPVPAGVDGSKAVIFHYYPVYSGKTYCDVIKPIYANGKLTFAVTHFSTFGIAEIINNSIEEEDDDEPTIVTVLEELIEGAEDGAVVKITRDMNLNALPNSIMHTVYEKKTVSLVMEYTYEDVEYTITIPAGQAVDADIAWYGPLYLSAHYGSASLPVAGEGQYYTFVKGDTLSKIAAKHGTSLQAIYDLNAGLASQKYIYPGQKIRVK